jgi:hypothetical protein
VYSGGSFSHGAFALPSTVPGAAIYNDTRAMIFRQFTKRS